jgi:hypothetical protein
MVKKVMIMLLPDSHVKVVFTVVDLPSPIIHMSQISSRIGMTHKLNDQST